MRRGCTIPRETTIRKTATLRATLLGALLALATGCATLHTKADREIVAANALGECQVELTSSSSKTTVVKVPVGADATVQKVLEQSGALRKFSRVELVLARALPDGNWHRMDVDYDRRQRLVQSETDYHVRPGDRLLVKEDPSTILDDMLEASLGSVGSNLGKKMR
jgi:hypothetical protein